MTLPIDETLEAAPAAEAPAPPGPLQASRAYASARDPLAWWQVLSTLAVMAGLLAAVRGLETSALRFLLIPVLIGVLIRVFVLQHDCGHLSLFKNRKLNDAVGTVLSFVTGIAYHAWRSEHNWHHNNQGRLSRRGVDRMNSPMTAEEAIEKPDSAQLRVNKISFLNVYVLGAMSLLLERKRHKAFFMFRPAYQGGVPDRDALVRSVWTTNVAHLLFHLLVIAGIGLSNWAFVFMPAVLLGGGAGAMLFWVQHNFEHTYHAPDGVWSYVEVALKGSSYLSLPWPLSWCTAQIGLHHVHHLNPLIPNYRLEEARRAIPELARVAPLTWADLPRSFSHVFWDGGRSRMVSPDELAASQEAAA